MREANLQVEAVLADLIRIESVNPPGRETEVARYLQCLFDRYAIPSEIIEPAPGRGSFIASLGAGDKSLLFTGHSDVVPASGNWSFDPFSGEIKDGFVRGRGALDCKGLLAAEAVAVIRLAQKGNLKGRLIFAAAADEECGSELGIKYLAAKHPDKLKADFAINEGAIAPVVIGGRTCHFIQTGEKGPAWIRLKTRGIAAHGSLPDLGDNAVVKMAAALKKLDDYRPPVKLIPEVRELLQAIARLQGFGGEIDDPGVDHIIGSLPDKNLTAYLKAVTRMTISPNEIQGGARTNIVPDSCEAQLDVRVLPGQETALLAELAHLTAGAEMEMMHFSAPTFSPATSPHYKVIRESLREFVGADEVLPCISSGATDSRFLREAGIPSYGIDMMTLNPDTAMARTVHGNDERIDIASLRLKTAFLEQLALKYLGN